jgi:hypothetical protein
MMMTNLKGNSRPVFRSLEIYDGSKKSIFDFNYDRSVRFALSNSVVQGSKSNYEMGVAFTPIGVTIKPAIQVGNQKLSEFIYDSTTGNFNATGTNSVSASIKFSNKPPILSDFYKLLLRGQPRSTFIVVNANGLSESPETDSTLFISELAKVNANLPNGVTVSVIALDFNFIGTNNYIFYVFSNNTYFYHYVNVTENATNKTVILTNKSWVGNAPNQSFEAIKNFDNFLLDPNGLYVMKEKFYFFDKNAITFTSASNPFRMTTWQLQ